MIELKINLETSEQINKAIEFLKSLTLQAESMLPDMITTSATPRESEIPRDVLVALSKTPTCAVEQDSAGVIWNAEVHTYNKTKTKNGEWRKERKNKTPLKEKEPDAEELMSTLMSKISSAVNSGILNPKNIIDIIKSFGIESIPKISELSEQEQRNIIPKIIQKIGV